MERKRSNATAKKKATAIGNHSQVNNGEHGPWIDPEIIGNDPSNCPKMHPNRTQNSQKELPWSALAHLKKHTFEPTAKYRHQAGALLPCVRPFLGSLLIHVSHRSAESFACDRSSAPCMHSARESPPSLNSQAPPLRFSEHRSHCNV